MKNFSLVAVFLIMAFCQISLGKTYEFKEIYSALKYTDQYFGATADELESLETYKNNSDNFFAEINGYLRFYPKDYEWYGTSPREARNKIGHIDRLIQNAPALPQDIILFRGETLSWHKSLPFEVGEEFFDKGYTSTSLNKERASAFAGGSSTPEDQRKYASALLILYFENIKAKGLLISGEEEEALLPHGLNFRVMDRRLNGNNGVYLIQICSNHCNKTIQRKDVISLWSITQ